jgi:hypothetical protein
MTPEEQALARPEFEVVDLDVDPDETRRRIEEAIKGLTTSETEAGVNYRTRGGTLVVVVGPGSDGGAGTSIAYRTAPPSEQATRKASKIAEALRPHAVDR